MIPNRGINPALVSELQASTSGLQAQITAIQNTLGQLGDFLYFTGTTTGTETITLGTIGSIPNPGDTLSIFNWVVYGRTADGGRGALYGRTFSRRDPGYHTTSWLSSTAAMQFGAGSGWAVVTAPALSGDDALQQVTGQGVTIEWVAFGFAQFTSL